jgi:hypothetical protein
MPVLTVLAGPVRTVALPLELAFFHHWVAYPKDPDGGSARRAVQILAEVLA